MKANELRIGSILFVPGLDRVVMVTAIFKTHFRCEDSNGVQYEESLRINYQPIPLTEEWMERLHYEDQRTYMQCFSFLHIQIWVRHGQLYFDYEGGSVLMEYVHQMQNLHFLLTGHELQIQTP